MRTTTIDISGNTCILIMNNRVLTRMEEAGLDLNTIGKDMPVTKIMHMLAFMIEAGSRYAAHEGLGEYPVIPLEDLLDMTGPDDYPFIQDAVTACVAGDRTVDSAPPKKEDATPQGRTA